MRYAARDIWPLHSTTKMLILRKRKRLKLSVKQVVNAIGVTRDTYYRMMQGPLGYKSGVGPDIRRKIREWLEEKNDAVV